MPATLPDVLAAVRALVAGKTSAGQNVSVYLGSARPFITYRRDGGPRISPDNRIDRARIVFECWGGPGRAGNAVAYTLAMELRGVMLPGVVHGYHGPAGNAYISNVEEDASPSYFPDPETGEERYRVSFLITYY